MPTTASSPVLAAAPAPRRRTAPVLPNGASSRIRIPAILARYGIRRFLATPLSGGHQNQTWLITSRGGRRVLRRHLPPGPCGRFRDAATVAWEHALLAHLATQGLPVAIALRAADGASFLPDEDGGGWALFTYREGVTHPWSKRFNPIAPDQAVMAIDQLAAFHRASASFRVTSQRPASGELLRIGSWIGRAFPGVERIDRLMRRAETATRGSPGQEFCAAHVDAVHLALDAIRRAADDPDLVAIDRVVAHCDYVPGNIGCIARRVSAIYDLDDAARDLRAVDVSSALWSWTQRPGGGFDHDLAGRLLRRYHRRFPLSAAELRHLPLFLVAKQLFYLLPAIARTVRDPAVDLRWVWNMRMPTWMYHLAARDVWARMVDGI